MSKSTVIVSRQWNFPAIRAFVDTKEVGAEIDLDDFIEALLYQVGSPTFMMTKKQLADKVHAAKEEVIIELKKATVHV